MNQYPHYYQPQPPKKSNTTLYVVIGIIGTFGLFILASVVTGGGKPGDSPSSFAAPAAAQEATPVDLGVMLSSYKGNEIDADNMYKGRRVQVSGQVGNIKKGLMGGQFVMVGTRDGLEIPAVQCHLKRESDAAGLRKGQTVNVEGDVSGLLMHVHLQECVVR